MNFFIFNGDFFGAHNMNSEYVLLSFFRSSGGGCGKGSYLNTNF